MKRISKLTLLLMAAASLTACGRVVSNSAPAAPKQPALTAPTTTVSGTTEQTTAEDTTTTADNENSSEAVTTTVTDSETAENSTVSENGTASNSGSVSAGGNSAAPAAQHRAAGTAPSYGDADYAPAPVQYDIPGITYINGVLIANKSYSLPADFNPGLDPTCQAQFNKLQSAAAQEGLNIWLASGFRSYDYQDQIYNNYVARDGQAAADTYSARPGYSEHQSGLAIDVNQIDDSFIGTPEAIWLEKHCHEFGFILRYPQGKQSITGYQYESWHIRYVGTDISYQIHDSGLTLEEFFGIDSYYH